MARVALREERIGDGPVDADPGVVPGDAELALRIVEIRALVLDLRNGAHHCKAVHKARRQVALAEVLGRKRDAHPLAEGRRTPPDVDGHVEDLSLDDANELALRAANL